MGTTVRNKSAVWSTGLAMFAMFFGAGNIVFPLALGQFVQDKSFPAGYRRDGRWGCSGPRNCATDLPPPARQPR